MSFKKLTSWIGLVSASLAMYSATSHAGFTTVSAFVEAGNECKSYYDSVANIGIGESNSFEKCNIFHKDTNNTTIIISPVIAKFGDDGAYEEGKTYKNEVQKGDWTFNGSQSAPGNGTQGTWEYSNVGVGIRYWSV